MIPGLEPPTFMQFYFGTFALFILAVGMLLSLYAPVFFIERMIRALKSKPLRSYHKEDTMNETEYRIYVDGTVVHEDDFQEYDGYDDSQPFGDDYRTVSVPDEIISYIIDTAS